MTPLRKLQGLRSNLITKIGMKVPQVFEFQSCLPFQPVVSLPTIALGIFPAQVKETNSRKGTGSTAGSEIQGVSVVIVRSVIRQVCPDPVMLKNSAFYTIVLRKVLTQ